MTTQQQLQELSDKYQDLQNELSSLVTARQRLEGQQQENRSVQKEFDSLDDEANVFKLVGPVLLKQDITEAKSTVTGRLEFIDKEINRIENSIKDAQKQSETKRMEIIKLQSEAQQSAEAVQA